MKEKASPTESTKQNRRRRWGAVLGALLCCGALLGLGQAGPMAAVAGPADSRSVAAQRNEEPQSPAPGSPERKAILDALRALVPEKDGKKALFVVRHLRLSGDWAWVETDPQSADGRDRYEPVECLLRNQAGSWTVQECRPCCGECEDDPDCRDKNRYYQSLRSRFPGAPPQIFPAP